MLRNITNFDRLLLLFSSIGILLLLVLFFYSPSEIGNKEPIAILTINGTAKRRPSNSLNWTVIKNRAQIFLKDTVYIPPKTSATAVFLKDNSTLTLEPNTMLQFDEITKHRMELIVLKGLVKIEQKPQIVEKAAATKEETKAPEQFWKIPVISYSLKIPKTITKLLKTEKPIEPLNTITSTNTVEQKNTTTKKSSEPKTILNTKTTQQIDIAVKPISYVPNTIIPETPPLVFKAQIKNRERIPNSQTQDTSIIINNIRLIEPLEISNELIKEKLEFTEKFQNYSKRTFDFISIEPLQLDSRYYKFTKLVEFLIKPVMPIANTTLKAKDNCYELVWTPIPINEVSYYLEISRDKDFKFIRSFGISSHHIRLNLNDNATKYLWRVRAVLEEDSLISELTSFNVNRPNINIEKAKEEKSRLPEWEVCQQ